MATHEDNVVRHFLGLLQFLHVDPWGMSLSGHFKAAVEIPFSNYRPRGLLYLKRILKRLLIRTQKQLVMKHIPLHVHDYFLSFTANHAKSYNRLAGLVQRNLLMSDWEDAHHVESLLNPRNREQATNTMDNVLKSCCIAGNMQFFPGKHELNQYGDDVIETVEMMMASGALDVAEKDQFESRLRTGCHCAMCHVFTDLPLCMPW